MCNNTNSFRGGASLAATDQVGIVGIIALADNTRVVAEAVGGGMRASRNERGAGDSDGQ